MRSSRAVSSLSASPVLTVPAGAYLADGSTIPLEQMGEGVAQIVGLLVELAVARDKRFLVEELENDLHPMALKALLDLVVGSAARNQLVVSTHSNIVLRHLGAVPGARIYWVAAERGVMPPVATVSEVGPDPADRMAVLRELGYELADFDLWDAWLFLEESSAERIIRDYLIPWFAPRLGQRIRTLSAGGNAGVEPNFADFTRLIRFTHLEPAYHNKAWVLIDGDAEGVKIVQRLRETYRDWDPRHFATLREPAFELYYPNEFGNAVREALGEPDRRLRRDAKRRLLEDVRAWVDEDPERGRAGFMRSAADVIERLRSIERELTD